MIEKRIVAAIRDLTSRGYAIKGIVRELGVGRNTVRRYLHQPVPAGFQVRPRARRLTDPWRQEARRVFAVNSNAAAVHRSLNTRGVQISARTVRRLVADLRPPSSHRGGRPLATEPAQLGASTVTSSTFEWEFKLLRRIAARFGGHDPEELEADLTEHLATLQPRQFDVRNWKAFLRTALRRKALNWIRDRKKRRQREISFDRRESTEDETTVPDRLADRGLSPVVDPAILRAVRRALDPWLRRVFDALILERMNQTRAAIRLGVHPNTIRHALQRISKRLKNREF